MDLRRESLRPLLVVDDQGKTVADPTPSQLGIAAPLGRHRLVSALKLDNNPPAPNVPARAVVADHDLLLFDPATASVIGQPRGVRINRLLRATRTRDTRRL